MLHGRMLRYLDEIVRSGSIRKASERLNVAASAINRQVLQLEAEIGTPIFERLPRRLRLTAAGELLILHVRQTLKEHETLGARMQALKGLQAGEVKIATVGLLASRPMVTMAARLRQRHPSLALKISVHSLGDVVATLLNGEADLALAYSMPFSPRMETLCEHDIQLGAVMAPGHKLASRPILRLSDCLAYPLVVPGASVSIRAILERALPTGAKLAPALETNSSELLRDMAAIPPHITFLNQLDIASEAVSGLLCRVPVHELSATPQRLSLVCRRDGRLDTAAYLVANALKEVLTEELAERAA